MQDTINEPKNYEGRQPEYRSSHDCPECGRRLIFLAADRLHYCRACEREYDSSELDPKAEHVG